LLDPISQFQILQRIHTLNGRVAPTRGNSLMELKQLWLMGR
jgi:hypothetical protein